MRFISIAETAPKIPSKVSNAYWKGFRFASGGVALGVGLAAIEAGVAQRGEVIPTLTGRIAALPMQPALTGLTSAAIAGLGAPPALAAVAAVALTGYFSSKLENSLIRNIRTVTKAGAAANNVRFSGSVSCNSTALQRRRRIASDMSGALTSSRRWLGQEASVLHS